MRPGAAKSSTALRSSVPDGVSRGFTLVEDVVYVGLGLLLSGAAVVLLVSLAITFWRGLIGGSLPGGVVVVLDQILLILMIVELLYTVQLSFREHVLIPEPFVLVALIASVCRILVLAPELPTVVERETCSFRTP